MTDPQLTTPARPGRLRRDGACLREGVARRPWMAGGMGTHDARATTTNPPRHQPQRWVEKCECSIKGSDTPHNGRPPKPGPPSPQTTTGHPATTLKPQQHRALRPPMPINHDLALGLGLDATACGAEHAVPRRKRDRSGLSRRQPAEEILNSGRLRHDDPAGFAADVLELAPAGVEAA
jgi:hypothetical protein